MLPSETCQAVTLRPDVVVAGGGIAGLTTALAAANAGLEVVIVDRARPGAASRAAAGLLAPSVEGLPAAVHAFAVQARDLYPEFLADLRERTGVNVPLNIDGILEIASSDAELAAVANRVGIAADVLDAAALAALEPALSSHAGALLHTRNGAVDNVELMRALDLAVARDSRITRLDDRVDAVDFSGGGTGVIASKERISADFIVLAAGAWTQGIVGLPRVLPVRPLRGQLIRLDRQPIRHLVYGAGGYLVPRGDSLIVGATSEEAGFINAPTSEGRTVLRSIATRAIPDLDHAAVLDHWAGLRPVTLDGLPILGPEPKRPSLVYACGYSRNGILFAPWAAQQLVPLFLGHPTPESLEFFSPLRFSRDSNP